MSLGEIAVMDQVEISMNPTLQSLLALFLIFIMFSVALSLRVSHFKEVLQQPGDVVKGLLVQVLALPAVTLAFIYMVQVPGSLALGLIIVASCPGGNVSNYFCRLVGADVAYSITLTALSSMIAMVMIPLSILFWGSFYTPISDLMTQIELDRGEFLLRTIGMLGLPLLAGMGLAYRYPGVAQYIQRWAMPLSMVLLFALIAILIWYNSGVIATYGRQIIGIVATHNMLAFGLGAVGGFLLLKSHAKRRALVFEVGLQNTGLGLVILLSEFKGLGGAALITATWGIWHFVTGFLLTAIYRYIGVKDGRPTY